MSDLLTQIASRVVPTPGTLRPRVASIFEPVALSWSGSPSLEEPPLELIVESSVIPAPPALSIERAGAAAAFEMARGTPLSVPPVASAVPENSSPQATPFVRPEAAIREPQFPPPRVRDESKSSPQIKPADVDTLEAIRRLVTEARGTLKTERDAPAEKGQAAEHPHPAFYPAMVMPPNVMAAALAMLKPTRRAEIIDPNPVAAGIEATRPANNPPTKERKPQFTPAPIPAVTKALSPRAPSLSQKPPAEPTVLVTIGRIEVRAPAVVSPPPGPVRSAPAMMTLAQYLQERNGGRR